MRSAFPAAGLVLRFVTAIVLMPSVAALQEGEPEVALEARVEATPTEGMLPEPALPRCTGKFSCTPIDQPLEIVSNVWVSSGQSRSFVFELVESYEGSPVSIPVSVIRGAKPGPTLLLTAAIHGDELIGLPILMTLRETLRPEDLAGMVVMLPVVNPFGFQRQTRGLPDGRDLNRYFPGNRRGSLANRIAHKVFHTFVPPSDFLIDFHTAASERENAPHARADAESAASRDLAQGFGGMVVIHAAQPQTLRHAAIASGVPTVVFEAGENGRIDPKNVEVGVRGVENVLGHLGMLSGREPQAGKPLLMRYSPWLRADAGGIVELAVNLGDLVQANQLLLTIRGTITGVRLEVLSPGPGIVMALARNPVTQPGNALLRLGTIEREPEAAAPPTEEELPEEE